MNIEVLFVLEFLFAIPTISNIRNSQAKTDDMIVIGLTTARNIPPNRDRTNSAILSPFDKLNMLQQPQIF